MEELKEERETIDKTALKNFAMNSREKLIQNIEMQLNAMGFYADNRSVTPQYEDEKVYKLHDREFSQKSRKKIREKIKENGFEKVVDEVAYTWFNRFIALYYMEVNEYISEKILSNIDSLAKYASVLTREVKEDEKQKVADCILNNKDEELLKTLLIRQCNKLSEKLPFLFEKFEDYTEELFPTGLFTTNSVIRNMVELDDKNWHEVEVIGWLYQYYNTDAKAKLDNDLKKVKGKKVQAQDMPLKTQIFTPNWIVKYMVENSLGKLWLESHPNEELKSNFKYYIEPAEQEEDVKKQLDTLIDTNLTPENITVLDPACGSGHILVVAFEVLYQIYKSYGYIEEDIPELILKNNLFGIDICGRAFQLAQLALVMSARKYDKNIFDKVKELNIVHVENSNWIDSFIEQELLQGIENERQAKEQIELLKRTFYDAEEYGSLIDVKGLNFDFWNKTIEYLNALPESYQATFNTEIIRGKLPKLIKYAKIMQKTYDSVIANPPYLGSTYFDDKLSDFMKKKYPDSKSDTCVAYIEKAIKFTKKNSYFALVTMQSWMFLSSFEEFRNKLLNNSTISTMTHMGNNVMRIAFGTCATIWKNCLIQNLKAIYSYVENDNINEKDVPYTFPIINNRYNILEQKVYNIIPQKPIAYWVKKNIIKSFEKGLSIDSFSDFTGSQHITANNDLFLRYFWEVKNFSIGRKKSWAFYSKGGEFRRWYGNIEYVVDIKDTAIKFYKQNKTSNYLNDKYWFQEGITYSAISSKGTGFRYYPNIGGFDKGGPEICKIEELYYFLGFLNTNITFFMFKILNPTINIQVNDIKNLPIIFPQDEDIKQKIYRLVDNNINISKDDWDSFETSWDFEIHPLLRFKENGKSSDSYKTWKDYKQSQFNQLKDNEEELNRLFLEIYGLQDEMTPDVEDKDITVALADEQREIKSLLSYAVGCMFGRYSLDKSGLAFAGGEFDLSEYKSFKPYEDNIIPILSKDYFHDDIITKLKEFLKVAFGAETLSVNLDYIADVLGRKGLESAEERIRKYFLNDFYKDHLQRYKKRPIYWQITSGKEKAFNALIYLHRYDKSSLSTARTKCLQYQEKIDTELNIAKENNDVKQQNILAKYKEELVEFDRRLKDLADQQIELDLDDGVKVNYAKFKGILDSEKEITGGK